jgi:hypothetical protein
MQEHTVDFPGFFTAPAGTGLSSSTVFISPRAGGRLPVQPSPGLIPRTAMADSRSAARIDDGGAA